MHGGKKHLVWMENVRSRRYFLSVKKAELETIQSIGCEVLIAIKKKIKTAMEEKYKSSVKEGVLSYHFVWDSNLKPKRSSNKHNFNISSNLNFIYFSRIKSTIFEFSNLSQMFSLYFPSSTSTKKLIFHGARFSFSLQLHSHVGIVQRQEDSSMNSSTSRQGFGLTKYKLIRLMFPMRVDWKSGMCLNHSWSFSKWFKWTRASFINFIFLKSSVREHSS